MRKRFTAIALALGLGIGTGACSDVTLAVRTILFERR